MWLFTMYDCTDWPLPSWWTNNRLRRFLRVESPATCLKRDETRLTKNKKTFQWDAYRPLANHTCFNVHQQMLLLGMWGGGGGSSNGQVWTGLQCWPPDVSSKGRRGPTDYLPIPWTDRRHWQHYLPVTSLAGDNKCKVIITVMLNPLLSISV